MLLVTVVDDCSRNDVDATLFNTVATTRARMVMHPTSRRAGASYHNNPWVRDDQNLRAARMAATDEISLRSLFCTSECKTIKVRSEEKTSP